MSSLSFEDIYSFDSSIFQKVLFRIELKLTFLGWYLIVQKNNVPLNIEINQVWPSILTLSFASCGSNLSYLSYSVSQYLIFSFCKRKIIIPIAEGYCGDSLKHVSIIKQCTHRVLCTNLLCPRTFTSGRPCPPLCTMLSQQGHLSSSIWRTGTKVPAKEMWTGFINCYQIQFATLLTGWHCTVSKSRNPCRTIDLTSKWLPGFCSGTNQIWKEVPQRTQLPAMQQQVTGVKKAWEQAISYYGLRD